MTDSPAFHHARGQTAQGSGARNTPSRVGLRALLAGRWARAFWAAFVLMTGLWLLTDSTVIILTSRLSTDAGLPSTGVGLAMGCASVAQAVFMALAGHLSSVTGRRRLFVMWGATAAVGGPLLWWAAVNSASLGQAALLAAFLQVVTVAAYGPVAAYLSELFLARLRSTGYGSAYSLSLLLPALYPFYLPWLESFVGPRAAVMGFVALGGLLVVLGARLGPCLSPAAQDTDIDSVALHSMASVPHDASAASGVGAAGGDSPGVERDSPDAAHGGAARAAGHAPLGTRSPTASENSGVQS